MECTIGGTRRHLVDVAREEARLGLDVHVVASTLRSPDFERDLEALEAAGVSVARLPMVRAISPWKDRAHLAFLRGELERVRPDVVHTHSSKAGVLGRLASMQTSIGARVHTPHTFSFLFEAEFSAPKRKLFREIERGLAGLTQALIAVSPSEGRTFVESGVVEAARVRVVPNGIDPEPWRAARPASRAELGVRDDAPFALVVGLFNIAKGQDLALDALCDPALARLQLVFAGHGALEAPLKERALRLGLQDRVRFLGFRTDVPALIAASDFVLVPSRWEGMPYAVIEALASSRAVVATPVDGARDVVVHGVNGFLARSIDAAALAESMRAMLALEPSQRAAFGFAGRARVMDGFTVGAMVEGLVSVYREVA
jgi:glycosyltransferase involved in cell wall biosynthesis